MYYKVRNNLIVSLKLGQALQFFKKNMEMALKGEENFVFQKNPLLLGFFLGVFFLGGFYWVGFFGLGFLCQSWLR